jgi:cytochrome c oxidase subunit 3
MMARYRKLLTVTLVLGVLFVVTQYIGFSDLWRNGFTLQSSVSYSFLYVIVGLHGLHVVGGVIALVVMSLKAFSNKQRNYSIVPVELIATYWHFVDILWIYLLLFLIAIR